MPKTKVGFIGGGGIAREHMKYLSGMDDVELAAVADINGGALDTCREMYGIPHCFEDYRELLAMDSIDAVTVGTPNSTHCEPTIDA
ncbi:MAG: Gfo/Idh/MocA family oxidoreductase, partial [Gemmatimonadota bacterium]|nr:Gfo/Idh/MocA family oxidoreductase [Gemmatimonadota bacterium]